ncbi:hypothetical protein GYH30_006747 [Glycine max]|uniref:Uncharacterized protein n=1 Tax=Glycine max TaxID=3847 RepID=A0A0R0KGV4_SOYBN|nr:hypothetical protein JHK87_006819 [Glycine soja]KAH1069265.1 hypothetical protein GYH30_006747 [Glycine max]
MLYNIVEDKEVKLEDGRVRWMEYGSQNGDGGGNTGSVPSKNSRLSPLPPEPYDCGATIDIPLDNAKEKELHPKEAELKRRE